jgi:hypothetical protein
MEVNFVLPHSVTKGVSFPVSVTVKHADLGNDVTVELVQVMGVPPAWPGGVQHGTAKAVDAGATDGGITFTFDVVLAGPCRAHLKATARTASGFDTRSDHTDVI